MQRCAELWSSLRGQRSLPQTPLGPISVQSKSAAERYASQTVQKDLPLRRTAEGVSLVVEAVGGFIVYLWLHLNWGVALIPACADEGERSGAGKATVSSA